MFVCYDSSSTGTVILFTVSSKELGIRSPNYDTTALILFRLLWARKLPRRIWFRLSSPYSRIARQRLVYVSFDFSVWHWTSFTPFFPLSSCPVLSCPLSVQVRAAAAHNLNDFCLALDMSVLPFFFLPTVPSLLSGPGHVYPSFSLSFKSSCFHVILFLFRCALLPHTR
jgi:hypothetical protein